MGLSSSVSRGHMRPFVGRSPPFLVATLCVGLCVLAVSYWHLGNQYNDLEQQFRQLIQKKETLEANESFISKQLELREENFSEAKVNLQKKEQELIDLKKRLDDDALKLKETEKSQNDLRQKLEHLKTELESKETSLKELRNKNKDLENTNVKLKSDFNEMKNKFNPISLNKEPLNDDNKSKNLAPENQDRSQFTNVIHPPDNLNNNLPKPDIPGKNVEKKTSEHQSQQQPQEQIQKPKIDPVVQLVKNNGNNNQNNNVDKLPFDSKDVVKNYDEDNGLKADDKDTLLNSNNIEDNGV